MTFGTVQVGRLVLTEAQRAAMEKTDASTGSRSLGLSGQESVPPLELAELVQRHADVVALPSSVVPVRWTHKSDRDGYYRVTDSGADLTNWSGEVVTSDWSMNLDRVGSDTEIDLESRLSGPLSRQNDHTVTGERIHAPAIGAYGYAAGTTLPTVLSRESEDGTVLVYRGLAVGTHPRWACAVDDYLGGRVRFIDADGFERSGTDVPLGTGAWELHNGLVKLRATGSHLEVYAFTGGEWRRRDWELLVGAVTLGDPMAVTLLRNEPEMVVLRMTWIYPTGPGRVTVDATLRRGFRFVELWIEAQTAATIRVQRMAVAAAFSGTGFLTASADDTAGNRWWAASLRTFDADVVNGALSKTATTTFGVALGTVVGGGSAVSGETGADLLKQYTGAASERVEGVRR